MIIKWAVIFIAEVLGVCFALIFGEFIAYVLSTRFLYGCWRKFKNGRKCRVWDCPNKDECPFIDEKMK